ncbi:MAG: TraR/DksA family transcriptional regulator [Candidatus Competibacteraceae bacterium]|jgi:RNA polymerase-binding protein DksA|nr:TraR/DksA family transcriptional regulator [Candidatus Competibacteraceae bacterium]
MVSELSKLSEQQINELRDRLRQRFAEVREEIHQELLRSDEESYLDLAGRVRDSEDESVANLLVDLKFAAMDRHVQEIRAIEAALARIREGSYGICSDCGDPIGFERQQAYPTAKRCYRCQTVYEKTHYQENHPRL